MKKESKSERIPHIHITSNKKIAGGKPIIKGTRISVSTIAEYFLMGLNPEEIKRELPHLKLAQIFDALAFYFDHRSMIDEEINKNREEMISNEFPSGKY